MREDVASCLNDPIDRAPDDSKSYELSRMARTTRWWRASSESASFAVGLLAIGALVAMLSGHFKLAEGLGFIGLFYLAYAHTKWFWWWN